MCAPPEHTPGDPLTRARGKNDQIFVRSLSAPPTHNLAIWMRTDPFLYPSGHSGSALLAGVLLVSWKPQLAPRVTSVVSAGNKPRTEAVKGTAATFSA